MSSVFACLPLPILACLFHLLWPPHVHLSSHGVSMFVTCVSASPLCLLFCASLKVDLLLAFSLCVSLSLRFYFFLTSSRLFLSLLPLPPRFLKLSSPPPPQSPFNN